MSCISLSDKNQKIWRLQVAWTKPNPHQLTLHVIAQQSAHWTQNKKDKKLLSISLHLPLSTWFIAWLVELQKWSSCKPPLLAHNVLAGDTWLDLLVGLGSSYACPSPSCWQPMLVSVIALHWIINTYTCLSFSSKDGGQWEGAFQMLFLLTHLLPPMSLVPCLLLPLYLWEKQVNGKHIYIALLFASEA